jgi:predicted ester cyclase
MSIEQNKKIVRAFARAINASDCERLDELVDPNFIRHSYAAPAVKNREALKAYLRSEFAIFPDGYESIEDMLAEGDKVAVRHGFRGTQQGQMGPYPPSGKVLTADYMAIYRIANGVIAESWAEWDNLSGLMQLGHYKPIT